MQILYFAEAMKLIQLLIFAGLLLFIMPACNPENRNEALYTSKAFTIYKDQVVQGDNVATVLSPTSIRSNYKSKESETYSRRIQFKFSINKKDNEFPPGKNHWLVVGEDHRSPVIVFGEKPEDQPEEPEERLPVNYEYTFRLDMRPVLQQFEEKGFYEAYDGSRVAEADFKDVFIAGASEPLTWDFSNLDLNGLALKDPDGDGIYELTVKLNPYDPEDYKEKTWELSTDISEKPSYSSDQPLVDALFNLSLEEAIMNIEPDSTLRTGAKWGGVWTRDVSYSILLAFAYHEPEVAKISLMRKVTPENRIIQDTGSGGAYPVSSDRTTWALAAWEIYKTTGDTAWLKATYEILENTLNDDLENLQSPTGLYRGESSFLDWREQTYPKWMDNRDIYVSENLGTNVVHFQAHVILSKMAKALGKPSGLWETRASAIKAAINEQLWMEEKGYYAQFLYGRQSLSQSPRFEALGEALAIIFDVADEEKAQSIIGKSPVTPFGTTCIYPQIPGIPPYHNNGIWPFVQSYWNWSAAKAGNETVLEHGLAAIYRAAALFLTNYENFVADNGDFMGTEINSHRMLWSMAGNLAMVHRIFMGINFEEEGIRFAPVIPKSYGGSRKLSNFQYREAILEIKISGHGNVISAFTLDGETKDEPYFPADLRGAHTIEIQMANNNFAGDINAVQNKFTPANPVTTYADGVLSWDPIDNADAYTIFRNGEQIETLANTNFQIDNSEPGEYQVRAIGSDGLTSFLSTPVVAISNNNITYAHFEDFNQASNLPYTNFRGKGFVETSLEKNPNTQVQVAVKAAGKYWIDFRYANGTGPWNTDNNCGIRTLYVNGRKIGSIVMPQRGTDEWSDWGDTNGYPVELEAGVNQIELRYEAWNVNMDGAINKAMLDYARCIKL